MSPKPPYLIPKWLPTWALSGEASQVKKKTKDSYASDQHCHHHSAVAGAGHPASSADKGDEVLMKGPMKGIEHGLEKYPKTTLYLSNRKV